MLTPIDFLQSNILVDEDSQEYEPLPAFYNTEKGNRGEMVTCWKMGFWERVRFLITGRVYLLEITFHSPIAPKLMATKFDDLIVQKATTLPPKNKK